MERPRLRVDRLALAWLAAFGILLPSTGCARVLATVVYVVRGNRIDAAFDGLKGKRVVVVCRPPASLEYRLGGVDRDVARGVSRLLAREVPKIDMVDQSEVESWTDEQEWDNVADLATAVGAQMVVLVDLESFTLYKGQTLYQGRADTTVTVYEVADGKKKELQCFPMGEVVFPANSAVPAQEKALPQFRRQFIAMLSEQIARHFYAHDAHIDFANDSVAHL